MTTSRALALVWSVLVATACSGSSNTTIDGPGGGGGDGSGGGGGDGSGSGSGSGNVPATITIMGSTASAGIGGDTPKSGVVVGAFKSSDDSMVAMGTSDGSGNFSITVTTNGVALDGYLKAAPATFLPTYLYSPTPIGADFTGATVELLDSNTLGLAATVGGATQTAGDGFIGMEVLDAGGTQVAGATITASSGTIRYSGSNGLPDKNATVTGADGRGYIFSAKPGSVTLGATKTGTTFASHAIKVFADSVTESIVQP